MLLKGRESMQELSRSPKAEEHRAHLTQKSGNGHLEFQHMGKYSFPVP